MSDSTPELLPACALGIAALYWLANNPGVVQRGWRTIKEIHQEVQHETQPRPQALLGALVRHRDGWRVVREATVIVEAEWAYLASRARSQRGADG